MPWVIFTLVLGLIAWIVAVHVFESKRLDRFVYQLASEPGFVVTQVNKKGGRLHIVGMKDPYAVEPSTVMEASGIDEKSVEFSWEPYQSAHPEFALRRMVSLFNPPPTISMTFDHGTLRTSGVAPRHWIEDARRFARIVPWIEQYDDQQVVDFHTRLNAPPSVTFVLQDKKLSALGRAPRVWMEKTRATVTERLAIDSYDDTQLVDADDEAWASSCQTIAESTFYFESGQSRLTKGQEKNLQGFTEAVERMIALSQLLGRSVRIDVLGHADPTGNEAFNLSVSRERAKVFADLLIGLGMDPSSVTVHAAGSKQLVGTPLNEASRARNRRVSFKISQGVGP
jgi:OOP family OmpA-OmpF porin